MKSLLYAPFSKVEEQDDGTLRVYGVASSESVDSEGEKILASAMKAALPDWLTFGNIREMHQPIAAGVAIECSVDDAGMTNLGAHIVDDSTCKKLRAGVLKGFSIGGKVTQRNAQNRAIIEGIRLTEISVVDRPACPDALISLIKFDAMKGTLNKTLWDVARLADILESLAWMQECAASEAAYEGDNSPIPAALLTHCVGLGQCLKDMVGEEVDELLAGRSADKTSSEDIEMTADEINAAVAAGITKFLTDPANAETLRKAAGGGQLAPLAQIDDALAKAEKVLTEARDTIAKRDARIAELEAQNAELAKVGGDVAKQHTDLVASLTAKGHLRVVSKSEDHGPDAIVEKAKDDKPTDALEEIRKSHRQPIQFKALAR